ncbi:MAG: plasmid mobilization relaxosome protein MobC [Acutalibacter sp.]|nr:plasmid mobilization relaxosome protein MobC [Acutalibacter sp.]
MRNRNVSIHIRLSQREYDLLCRQCNRAGLPKSTYLRFMIEGLAPQDAPPPEYRQTLQALYRIGNNLNQLSAIAHAKGWLHAQKLEEALGDFSKTILLLTEQQAPKKANVKATLERGRLISEMEEAKC